MTIDESQLVVSDILAKLDCIRHSKFADASAQVGQAATIIADDHQR